MNKIIKKLQEEIKIHYHKFNSAKKQLEEIQSKCKHKNLAKVKSVLTPFPYFQTRQQTWLTICPDCGLNILSPYPKGKTDDGPGAPN